MVARQRYGNNYAALRRARADIVDLDTGKRIRVPFTDIGPGDAALDNGVATDMTHAVDQYFNNQGGNANHRFAINIVDDAGPDVKTHYQDYINEQAELRAGHDMYRPPGKGQRTAAAARERNAPLAGPTPEPEVNQPATTFTPAPEGKTRQINGIVLHSTDSDSNSSLSTLTGNDPDHRVSAHYLVYPDGKVDHLVADNDIAWHATSANPDTIGIEQVHIDGQEGWSKAQVQATAHLVADILSRHPNLTVNDVVGHSDVDPERKVDPVDFPWDEFRRLVAEDQARNAGERPGARTASGGRPIPELRILGNEETAQVNQAIVDKQKSDFETIDKAKEGKTNLREVLSLLDKPISGVSQANQAAYKAEAEKHAIAEVRDYLNKPAMSDAEALKYAREDVNVGTAMGEIMSKWAPNLQRTATRLGMTLQDLTQQGGITGYNRLAALALALNPNASRAEQDAFVNHLTSVPKSHQADVIYEYIKQIDQRAGAVPGSNIAGIDVPKILDAIQGQSPENKAAFQAQRAKLTAELMNENRRLRSDPRIAGTGWETWTQLGAQAPVILAQIMSGGTGEALFLSDIFQQSREDIRREHPDWSERDITGAAAASVLLQAVPALGVLKIAGGKFNILHGKLAELPLPARVAAGTIVEGGTASVLAATQQIIKNAAEGRPLSENVDESLITSGVIAGLPAAVRAAWLKSHPHAVVPRAEEPPKPEEPRIEPPPSPAGEPPKPPQGERPAEEQKPVPPEGQSNQQIEEQTIPPHPADEGERTLTDQEADAHIQRMNDALEERYRQQNGDTNLNAEGSVHSNGETPPTDAPPERFSLRERTPAAVPAEGVTLEDANKVVAQFREQFPHAPDINVVASRDQLPPHIQEQIRQYAGDHAVEAVTHDGQVHVVAGENLSPEHLRQVLLEETIGHYGIEQVLGDKFNEIASEIARSRQSDPRYQVLRRTYGDDPHTLAAEYLARTARNEIQDPGLWTRIKAWFNGMTRRLGFQRPFSDSEMRVLLSKARGRIEKGGGRRAYSLNPPRFSLRERRDLEAGLRREGATPEMRRSPGRLWYRSLYDELSRNPLTQTLARAVMHHVDRARELAAQLYKPIREVFKTIPKKDLKTVLSDFAKIQEAKDNKQPIPTGLHPKAYELNRAWEKSAALIARLADQNKILVRDPRLNGGKGGWRKFSAVKDYVPRSVRRDVIDTMRNRQRSVQAARKWKAIVDEFVNKGYAKTEAEVIEKLKDAANLDTKHVDKKMGNIEKARTSRLPSSMYDYRLSGMLDYIRAVSDRMAQIEAYGQKGGETTRDLWERTVERINESPIKGTREAKNLIGYLRYNRNKILGLDTPPPLGKAMAIARNVATGLDLSGWSGMVNDLIGSTLQVPSNLGIWNTAKGYYHALTHFKSMLHEARDLGAIHDDFARATRELEHDFSGTGIIDKLGRVSSKFADVGMNISLRNAQEPFIRVMTLGAAKAGLRDAINTIRANPMSRQAGAWAHYLARRGVDVSKIIEENGQGPETDRLLRRVVADTQAGYDFIQRSPLMDTASGKFFLQYLSWGVNQTRNMMREMVLPLVRPEGKTIDVTVNGKKYTVNDSRYQAAIRGLILLSGATATGLLKDQYKEFFLGKINSFRDLQQLAADIASNPGKAETWANVLRAANYQLLTSGMLGLLGNGAQLLEDPTDRSRYKDLLHPTAATKLQNIWGFIMHQIQEGQFDSHEADAFMRNNFAAYREGKPMLARGLKALGFQPDWIKEEMTRESVTALRNTLRRFNDEQGLGLKPPAFSQDYALSQHTPAGRSIVDALYRGDALAAKKLFTDYVKAGANPAERQKRAKALEGMIQSANPLKLGSKSNKDFAIAFWKWAQAGNVTPAQIAEYRDLVNRFANAAYAAGFKRELQIVPEKGTPVTKQKRAHTLTRDLLREAIAREQAARQLMTR
jgi:N-acetyl-anhydromuramyl-L-alanine amidase AmpD